MICNIGSRRTATRTTAIPATSCAGGPRAHRGRSGLQHVNVGPELEYFLFKDSSGTETLDEGGYFAMTTMDAATELRNRTIAALEGEFGIPIEYHHHEVGPSQHEIDMRYARALDVAECDQTR